MEEKESKGLFRFFMLLGFTGVFLAICIHGKLIGDYQSARWESLATRIALMGLAGMLPAWIFYTKITLATLKQKRDFALTALFLAVLFYPLISQFSFIGHGIKDVSRQILTQAAGSRYRQASALLHSFSASFETYAQKNFHLPHAFINLDALVKIYGLRISPNTNVAVGKNGFYFEGWGARRVEQGIVEKFDNIADYMGQTPFNAKELRQWKRTLEERSYWLKEQGIDFVFVLAPTKAFVYPEYLPEQLREIKGKTRYEQLSQYLRNYADIHFIDLLPTLLRAKKERDYPLLFYKTDFHWNFYGSFVVYQEMISRLAQFFPDQTWQSPQFSDFDLKIDEHWAHHRFLNMIGLPDSLNKNEHYVTMVPQKGGLYDSALDLPKDGIHDVYPPQRKIKAPDGSFMRIRLILNPKAPLDSILLLGDSFMEKCVYYFSANAKRVLNYRTIVNFPDNIFHYEKPDIVIQEILNMFVLRPPPTNPAGLADHYLLHKFERNAARVLYQKTFSPGLDSASGSSDISVPLPQLAPQKEMEFRVGRIEINAATATEVTLNIVENGHIVGTVPRQPVQAGVTPLYFEPVSETGTTVTVSVAGSPQKSLQVRSVEIRSDMDM